MVDKKTNKSIFATLVEVDVSKHTYDKPGNRKKTFYLTYLNWAWAYSYLMFYDPDAKLHFKEFPEYDFQAHQCTGRKVDYMNTANGAYVVAELTVKGKTKQQALPVMDSKNETYMNPPITAINKAKQRAFVKCLALFGLGLSLFMDDKNKKRGHGAKRSGGSNSKPTPKQQSTIKWLIGDVGPHLVNGDVDTFNRLKSKCGTIDGASKFITWLFDKKDAFKKQPPRQSDRIGSTGNAKQGSLLGNK